MTKVSFDTVTLLIKLTPGASENKFVRLERDLLGDLILHVRVTAIPEKGMANKALIKLLSKKFKLSKSSFEIKRGTLSRTKMFMVKCPENLFLEKCRKMLLFL